MVQYARITPILAAIAVCLLFMQCALEPMPDAATYLTLDTLPDTCAEPTPKGCTRDSVCALNCPDIRPLHP